MCEGLNKLMSRVGLNTEVQDEWNESDHPRGGDGKFGSGGSHTTAQNKVSRGAIAKQVVQQHQEMYRDAGKMREYVVKNFGPVLFEGGSGTTMQKGKQFVQKLAKATGQSEQQVMKDLRKDYQEMYK